VQQNPAERSFSSAEFCRVVSYGEVQLLKIFRSYHPYAFTAIFCWSLAYVFTRLALGHFSPLSLGFLRCLFASVVLGAVGFRTGMKLPRREDLKYFAAAGAAGFFIYLTAFNKGIVTVNSATSSIIISSAPVLTALLEWNRPVGPERGRAVPGDCPCTPGRGFQGYGRDGHSLGEKGS
jgi:uncharacterized membrane protein